METLKDQIKTFLFISKEIRTIFAKYDKKKNGYVKTNFVVEIFTLAGQNPTQLQEKQLMNQANSDGFENFQFYLSP